MQILILPPVTTPPASPGPQRHTPRSANDYQVYRPCLRWDAGFTCCFCLLHESDLAPTGAEATGLTWICHSTEHHALPAGILTQTISC